jgi:hypothetical protein
LIIEDQISFKNKKLMMLLFGNNQNKDDEWSELSNIIRNIIRISTTGLSKTTVKHDVQQSTTSVDTLRRS